MEVSTIDSNTILGAAAVLVSLAVSVIGLVRTWRLDSRTAKKQEIDTVIENYRLMLTESKERERKLEDITAAQQVKLDKAEDLIAEQRIIIGRLEHENTELREQLQAYRSAKGRATHA